MAVHPLWGTRQAPWDRYGTTVPREPRLVGHAFLVLLVALLIVSVIAAMVGVALGSMTDGVRRYTDVSIPPIPVGPQTTFVYDRHGREITALHAEVDRTIVPLSKISPDFIDAAIAIEDEDFYRHGGLDATAIFRAAWENTVEGRIEQGGSTITQQFVKNVFTTGERTLERKMQEAVLAVKLENQFTKDEILEKYLNTVYFGHGAYGAEAAAQRYFAKPAHRLNVLESATLAGFIAAPGRFDPARDRDAAAARRNLVLDRMARLGFITPDEAQELETRRLRTPGLKRDRPNAYPYFMQHVVKLLVREDGYNRTFKGGLRVTTTLDPDMQSAAEAAVNQYLPYSSDPSAALVAIEPNTGAIRALVGGRDFRREKFNLATQGRRQTGSAFKVFTLVAALEKGIGLDTMWSGPGSMTIDDARCFDPVKQEPWDVSNYGDAGSGTMSLASATAQSVNTIFAQLVVDVGPENVGKVARKMGIASKLEPVCSITLGSQSVTPLEMTSAYATLAARGVHHPPIAISEIEDASGRVVHRSPTQGRRVLDMNDADAATYALRRVVESGTGTRADIGRPVAGKTGTAQNYQDAWFCGYTPQLATCVWVGHRKGEIPMEYIHGFPNVYGGSIPAMIWHDFMAEAHAGLPVMDFVEPDLSRYQEEPEGSIVYTPPPAPEPTPKYTPEPVEVPPPSPEPSPGNGGFPWPGGNGNGGGGGGGKDD